MEKSVGESSGEDVKRSADAISEVTMCEVLDRIEARGVSRGIVQGKAEGKAEGRAQANERNMKIVGELLKQGRTDELLKTTRDFCLLRPRYEETNRRLRKTLPLA